MDCARCGRPIPEEAARCGSCGKSVVTVAAAGEPLVPAGEPAPPGVRRQRFWEIVARRLDDDSEQVLARQAALSWTAPPLAASKNHIAYVADDGTVKLFEWRTD